MKKLLRTITLIIALLFSTSIKVRYLIVIFFLIPFITSCKTITIPPEIQAASYVLRGIQFYFAYMAPSEITVQSKGLGKDENEAIDKAIIAAVQQAMGVLVVSELTASDEKILTDLAGMYSSGIVKSYEKKNCIKSNVVECTIEAKVRPLGIRESIFSNKSTQIVDGKSLHGQYSSAKASLIQRRKLTEYYMSRIRSIGLRAKVESIEIIPSMTPEAEIALSYSIDWNENFRSEMISFLKHISDGSNLETELMRQMAWYVNPLTSNQSLGDISSEDPNDVLVRWGPMRGILNQAVTIKTYDKSFAMMIRSKLQEPIEFDFSPFGLCDSFTPYGYHGILFFAHWQPVIRKLRFKISPDILRKTQQIHISAGCAKKDQTNHLVY